MINTFLKWCDMPSFYPGVLQCSTLPKDDIRSLPAISVSQSADSSWYYMSLYEHNTMYCPASDSSSVTCRYIKSKIIASNKRTNCICITYPGLKVLDKYSQLKLRQDCLAKKALSRIIFCSLEITEWPEFTSSMTFMNLLLHSHV